MRNNYFAIKKYFIPKREGKAMKKIIVIISVIFLVISCNVCFAAKTPFLFINAGSFSGDELVYAEPINDEKEIETSCRVVLNENRIIDIAVTIEIFDIYSGLRDGIINYHAYIEEGKLSEDPLIFTEIQESGSGIKIVHSRIADNYDVLKKECINDIKNLPRSTLKKINQAFENK